MTPRILALSSRVAVGHVGLSAIEPIIEGAGVALAALPTVTLSNHAGWPSVARLATPIETLRAMVDAIDANGWLDGVDTLLTGYCPSAAHVAFCADLALRLRARRPGLRFVCDPVLGDAPKGLYVPPDVAEAMRQRLVPLADLATPNWFELGWLASSAPQSLAEGVAAARKLGAVEIWATSAPMRERAAPFGEGGVGVLAVDAASARLVGAARLPSAPHGAGDALSALAALGLPLADAVAQVTALLKRSAGSPHLVLEGDAAWRMAAALEERVAL